ncbi:MAG: class I SAM-dependent methyltransferase [Candidatus Binatia bacterium]
MSTSSGPRARTGDSAAGAESLRRIEPSRSGWVERLRLRHPYPLLLERMAQVPPAERPRIRVLDVPAGNGVLTIPLHAAGFDVVGCDLFPETIRRTLDRFRGASVEETFAACSSTFFTRGLRERLLPTPPPAVPERPGDVACVPGDMEERLPFPDGDFDVVLCVEGIEHVKNRHRLLEELRRVLRRGGRLILTTPNMLSVRARVAYCFAGQRAFQSYIDEYTDVWGRSEDGRRVFHGHAFLINYFQARYSLHHCGFRIRRLLRSNVSPTSFLLLPLLYPAISGFTRLSQRKARRHFARLLREGAIPPDAAPPYHEMLGHVLSSELLLNSIMIVEAEAV